jgi:hypothetical protein
MVPPIPQTFVNTCFFINSSIQYLSTDLLADERFRNHYQEV